MFQNKFEQWIKSTFYPCGIVYSTDEAKTILKKNNLTPGEFLRPFGDFKNKVFTINLGEMNIKSIKNYRIDFYDSEKFEKIKVDQIPIYLYKALSNKNIIPNWNIYDYQLTKDCLEPIFSQMEYYSFPWFEEYEKLYFELSKFNEAEMYQQPLIYIYLCSVKDLPNCVDSIKFQQNPLLISEGVYEGRTTNLIILLNDKKSNNFLQNQECNEIVSKFKEKYYSHQIICFDINTEPNIIEEDIWGKYIQKIEIYDDNYDPTKKRGCYISKKERENFNIFFFDFFQNYVVKELTKLIDRLKEEIAKNKKGFLSLFKKDYVFETIKCFNIYKLTPYEKKIYLISILYFYFQDYENSSSYLKMLQSELKGKSTKHENGVLLLYSICKFIKSDKKQKLKLNTPYLSYLKYLDQKGAFKAYIIQLKMQESLGQFQTISDNVEHYLSELYDIRYFAPLLKEKKSFYNICCYRIPKFRKFILETILAANSYQKEEEKFVWKYILNCFGYLSKLLSSENNLIYRKTKVYYYEEMGKICDKLNYYEGGLLFYKRCIELISGEVFEKGNDDKLINYYNSYINSIDKNGQKLVYNSFIIPHVDLYSFMLIDSQDYEINNFISNENEEKNQLNFGKFEKYTIVLTKKKYCNLTENDIQRLNYLNQVLITKNKSGASFLKYKKYFISNEGKIFYCKFSITNILNIQLELKNVTLVIVNLTNQSDSFVNCEKKDIIIDKKTKKEIEIKFEVIKKGKFEIRGIEMTILPNIVNQYLFNTKRKDNQLYRYRIKKKARNTIINKNNNYIFEVFEKEKNIKISFPEGKDISLYQNSLYYYPIKILNNLSSNVKKFTIFISDNENQLNKYFMTEFIFQSLPYQEEKMILIPVLASSVGKFYATVIVKFEEEIFKKEIEIKRFVIKMEVKPSVNILISSEVLVNNKETNNTSINLNLQVMSEGNNQFSDVSLNKDFIFNSNVYHFENFKEYFMMEKFDKYFYSIVLNVLGKVDNKNGKISNSDFLYAKLIEIKQKYSIENIDYVKQIIENYIIKKDKIVIPFTYKDNLTHEKLSSFFFYTLSYNDSEISIYSRIHNILNETIYYSTEQQELDENTYCITLKVTIDKFDILLQYFDLINISLPNNFYQKDVEWIGSRSYLLTTFEMRKVKKKEIYFCCLIKKKGDYQISNLLYNVRYKSSKENGESSFTISNVSYPINISIS